MVRRHLGFINKLKNKKSGHRKWREVFFFMAGGFFLVLGVITIWLVSLKIPDFNSFEDRKISGSTKIYDRTGEVLLYDIHEDVKRTVVPLGSININMQNATIAIEDAEFYNHQGIRPTSIIRAVLANLFSTGRTQGGSTITQQLVKNTLLTQKKTITRKIKEWVLAIKIEQVVSKDKILELYLNESPYGGTIYGVEEASKTYFGKSASELGIAESAYLSAIPQAPTTLSPFGKNRDKLESRKNLVLSRMFELGYITREEHELAKNEVVVFKEQDPTGIKAPHFVFFIKDYLEKKYGAEKLEKGGLKVTTTLDYDLQAKAEEYAKEEALKNKKDWNGENISIVAIDPKTGHILTMVGSRDYFDTEIDGNFNVATALRQPGSSFKPFIYATAFNKGFTPNTVLFDVPTEFQTTCNAYGQALPGKKQSDCYMPENYDGKNRGPMTLRSALAESINVPAVKLFYLSGLNDSLRTAQNMGISTLSNIGRYGLTLVIGGGEVSLLDITSAYSVFANNGIKNQHTGILKVEDETGEILEEYTPNSKEILPKNTALMISDILSDNQARIPTFGANSSLSIPGYDVAGKTGTTNNNKDAWLVGYAPGITIGVWAGNNDNTPMKKGGIAMAGPAWKRTMSYALSKIPKENFEEPNLYFDPKSTKPALRGNWQGGQSFFVDKISSGLATELTPKETLEERALTNVHTILFWVDKNNITGPAPQNPGNDPQFRNWETAVLNWWSQNSYKYPFVTEASKPNFYDNVHTDANRPKVNILEPSPNNLYEKNQPIKLLMTSSGVYPIKKIDIFINNIFIETVYPPFSFSFIPNDLDITDGVNQIKVVLYDSVYNSSEVETIFKVNTLP